MEPEIAGLHVSSAFAFLALGALAATMLAGCGAAFGLGAPLATATLDPPRRRFATGRAALCAVRAPGELVCWSGEIGGDRMRARGALGDVVEVAVGDTHVCALRANGEVLCFGHDDEGQLGDPRRSAGASDELLPVPGLPRAVRLAASGDATCAVTEDGELHCFGKIGSLVRGAPRRAGPTRVPGVADVLQLAMGPSIACAVKRDGTAFCWGALGDHGFRDELADVHDAVEIVTSGIVRCVRHRAAESAVTCSPHPTPTQGYGGSLASERGAPRWPFPARDATAIAVDWAAACVVREGGRVECTGYDGDDRVAGRALSDLDGADAMALVSGRIGCGIDARGGVHTTPRAHGFCGELRLVEDGTGRNPSEGGGEPFSADLAPGLRLGSSWLSGAGHEGDGRFTTGLHVPLLFGTGLRAGPFVDVGTRGFGTVEPAAGAGLAANAGLALFGVDAGLGHAFARGDAPADSRTFAVFAGRLGLGARLDGQGCKTGCGVRYLTGAALEVQVRRSLGDGHPNDVGFFFSFDPALLALPFALFSADWRFR